MSDVTIQRAVTFEELTETSIRSFFETAGPLIRDRFTDILAPSGVDVEIAVVLFDPPRVVSLAGLDAPEDILSVTLDLLQWKSVVSIEFRRSDGMTFFCPSDANPQAFVAAENSSMARTVLRVKVRGRSFEAKAPHIEVHVGKHDGEDGPLCDTQIYNSNMRRQELQSQLVGLALTEDGAESQLVAFLSAEVTMFCIARDGEALRKRKKSLVRQLGDNGFRTLADCVSRNISMHFEREWTSHGLHRSFRFWRRGQIENYLRSSAYVIDALKQVSPFVSCGFGTVLGAVRDGALIPHDDDIDLLVAFEMPAVASIDTGLDLVRTKLESVGCEVLRSHFSHMRVRHEGPALDVFVGMIEDSRVSWFPGKRAGIAVEDVFPVVDIALCGIDLPMPGRPLKYLDSVYGVDWRSPNSQYRHPADRNSYSDLKPATAKQ